jgi:hypothetical protein
MRYIWRPRGSNGSEDVRDPSPLPLCLSSVQYHPLRNTLVNQLNHACASLSATMCPGATRCSSADCTITCYHELFCPGKPSGSGCNFTRRLVFCRLNKQISKQNMQLYQSPSDGHAKGCFHARNSHHETRRFFGPGPKGPAPHFPPCSHERQCRRHHDAPRAAKLACHSCDGR